MHTTTGEQRMRMRMFGACIAMLGGLLGVWLTGATSATAIASHQGHSMAGSSMAQYFGGQTWNSPFWAGYEAISSQPQFFGAQAYWIVPSVICPAGSTSYSAMWSGVGTGNSTADPLYQTGTNSNCIDGTPTYSAWWEIYQVNAQQILADPVSPGDKVYSVVYPVDNQPGNSLDMTLTDYAPGSTTPRWTETQEASISQMGLSAECVVEQTQINGKGVGLANFGTTTMNFCIAYELKLPGQKGNGDAEGLTMPGPGKFYTGTSTRLSNMVDGGGKNMVKIAPVKKPHGSFTVTWKRGT